MNMRKRYSMMVLAMMMVASVFAGPVDKGSAREIANNFLQKKGKSVKTEPARAPRMKGQTTTSDNASYYVFNASDNKGFVIVSGDDQTAPVLGYSMNGRFDETTMPPSVKAWLESYARQIEIIAAGKGRPARVPIHSESISQRVTSTWNQTAPYNNLCVFDGVQAVTGCVATAGAQVLYWNRYPQQVTAIPGYVTSPEGEGQTPLTIDALPIGEMDWDNMLDSYTLDATKKCTDPEVNQTAVAKLMRYVGQAARMEYTEEDSGTSLNDLISGLVKYFGYDNSVTVEIASSYSLEGWDNLIYNELKKRPVVMGGQTSDGGHAFVIDGYDSTDGTYYVNWGWGGDYDGQYLLRVLNPEGGGVGSGATNEGYSMGQEVIIGLTHDGTTVTERYLRGVLVLDAPLEDAAGNTTTEEKPFIAFGYRNPYYEAADFDIGLAFLDDEGNIIADKTAVVSSSMNVAADGNENVLYFLLNNAFGMEPGGQYRFTPVSREHGDSEWHRMYDEKFYYEVDYTDADHYEVTVHPDEQIEIVSVNVDGSMAAFDDHTCSFTIKNIGEEFCEPLYFFVLAPKQEAPEMVAAAQVTLEPDEEKTYSFEFTPLDKGTYQLFLATDDEGEDVVDGSEKEVTIEGIKHADIEPKGAEYGNDGNTLYVTIQNNTEDKTYTTAFIAKIFLVENGNATQVAQAQSPFLYNDTYYIQPNSSKAIPFDLGTTLAKGIYKADIRYASTFAGTSLDKSMELFFEIDDTGHTTTGINTIDNLIQFDGDAIYDLSGRKIVDNYAFLRRSALQASKARVRIKKITHYALHIASLPPRLLRGC